MNAPVRPTEFTNAPPYVAFTSREYQQMVMNDAFGDCRVELVRGELRKMMGSGLAHGEKNFSVAALLQAAYAPIAVKIGTDVIVEIDELTTLAADVVVVRPEFDGEGVVPAPDALLVVEICRSSQTRDLVAKPTDYGRAGIADYWVVDIRNRSTRVFGDPFDGGYKKWRDVPFGEPVLPPEANSTITIS